MLVLILTALLTFFTEQALGQSNATCTWVELDYSNYGRGWNAVNPDNTESELQDMFRGAPKGRSVNTNGITKILFQEAILGCTVLGEFKMIRGGAVGIAAVKEFHIKNERHQFSTLEVDFGRDMMEAMHIIPSAGQMEVQDVVISYCKDHQKPCQPPVPCINGGICSCQVALPGAPPYNCTCPGIYYGIHCGFCEPRALNSSDVEFGDTSYDNIFTGTYTWIKGRSIVVKIPGSVKLGPVVMQSEYLTSVQLLYDGVEMKHWKHIPLKKTLKYNKPSSDKVSVIELVRTGDIGKISRLTISALC